VFIVLFGLIAYALLTFGAVLPNSWYAVTISWLAAISVWIVYRAVGPPQGNAAPLFVLLAAAVLLLVFTVPKFAIGLIAGIWAWASVRESDNHKTLRFFKALVMIGVLEALLGLVQFFISPGWIFGYINPGYGVSGTLINRNHFAGLLEMLIPLSFGLAYIAHRRHSELARPYLYLLTAAFMGLSLVLSVSRTGILSFFITVFFLALVLQLRKSQRKLAVVLSLSVVALVFAGALWIGLDVVVDRYADLFGQDALLREGRLLVFRDVIRMIQENPWGVGIGNFQDRFREYQTFRPDVLFDHAHSDYLETAAEWGLPIAATFWAFLIFVVIRGVRLFVSASSPEQRGILLACSGAILSILIHSLADFNLQIPSNAMLFFSFVGISLGTRVDDKHTGVEE
jgi:O-antigen ligase